MKKAKSQVPRDRKPTKREKRISDILERAAIAAHRQFGFAMGEFLFRMMYMEHEGQCHHLKDKMSRGYLTYGGGNDTITLHAEGDHWSPEDLEEFRTPDPKTERFAQEVLGDRYTAVVDSAAEKG